MQSWRDRWKEEWLMKKMNTTEGISYEKYLKNFPYSAKTENIT